MDTDYIEELETELAYSLVRHKQLYIIDESLPEEESSAAQYLEDCINTFFPRKLKTYEFGKYHNIVLGIYFDYVFRQASLKQATQKLLDIYLFLIANK